MQVLGVERGAVCRAFAGAILRPLGRPDHPDGSEYASTEAALRDWAKRYRRATVANDRPALVAIGREMMGWLGRDGTDADWYGGGTRALEIRGSSGALSDTLSDALLEAPWEVLYRDDFLAADPLRSFVVSRRMADAGTPTPAEFADLRMTFMAAAPEDQSDLAFEAEELAILEATGGTAQVLVEESGALEFLRTQIDSSSQVLHLSCHGGILAPRDAAGQREGAARPVLFLERPEGGRAHEVSAPELVDALEHALPPLVFVSACATAQRGKAAPRRGAEFREGLQEATSDFARDAAPTEAALADPFVRDLAVRVPNVLGWDGSVYDRDASRFAEVFYGALALRQNVPAAAAKARRALLDDNASDPEAGRHWHLARVYLGAGGGGALCVEGGKTHPQLHDPAPVFLDPRTRKIPVAGRETFVGRRRAIQHAIATFRAGPRGVLVHGMGNLGKSSLAARIAARLTDLRTAVVVGRADAGAIFLALRPVAEEILAAHRFEAGQDFRAELDQMEQAIAANPDALQPVLQRLLAEVFADAPVFLVLDDFEKSLPAPGADGAALVPHDPGALKAVIAAFAKAPRARLMITSRYDFALPEGGADLSRPFLERLPLRPMDAAEQRKQWRALARDRTADAELRQRALAASGGNPGLQDVLTRPLLDGAAAEAEAAIATVEAFLARGERPPANEDPGDFFQRMSFGVYEAALSGTEKLALSVTTLFSDAVPIPAAALTAAMEAAGIAEPDTALARLLTLGLVDDHGAQAGWPAMDKVAHAACNPLARPLADPPEAAATLAAAALPGLATGWRDNEDDFPFDPRGVEAARLALIADPADAQVLDQAAEAAVIFLFQKAHDAKAALALGRPVLARLADLGQAPSPVFSGHLSNAAKRVGDVDLQAALITAALERNDLPDLDRGQLLGQQADIDLRNGAVAAAEAHLDEALVIFARITHPRLTAITKGKIADILQRRGDLDGALAMHLERLPIVEDMGDLESRAHIRFSCAQIRLARGDHERGGMQQIFEEVDAAFRDALQIQRADFIGPIGMLLGQILAGSDQTDAAIQVLTLARDAYDRLGFAQKVADCTEFLTQLDPGGPK